MEMKRLLKRIEPFHIHWPTDSDCNRAVISFAQSRLSYGLSILDALIAECAMGLNATLCTFNTRHFRAFPGLRTEQPYEKS